MAPATSDATFPHARAMAKILLPYAAPLAISFGALLAGLQFPESFPYGAIRSFLGGAGLLGCGVTGFFVWMIRDLILKEWKLDEDERRAAFAKPEPKPVIRVPFPPVRFVTAIWDARDKTGKFPTVDELEAAGFNRQLVQEWFKQCTEAGAIVNRIPKQAAGEPGPGWDRARFVQVAITDNSM